MNSRRVNLEELFKQQKEASEKLQTWSIGASCIDVFYYDNYAISSEMEEYIKVFKKDTEYKVFFDYDSKDQLSEYVKEWSLDEVNTLLLQNNLSPKTKVSMLKAQEFLQISQEKNSLEEKIQANRVESNKKTEFKI